jgi:hypothetical protein
MLRPSGTLLVSMPFLALSFCYSTKAAIRTIQASDFGKTQDGAVTRYVLANQKSPAVFDLQLNRFESQRAVAESITSG